MAKSSNPFLDSADPRAAHHTPDGVLAAAVCQDVAAHEAFGELYRRHAGRLAGYLHHHGVPWGEVDDLMQDTFTLAWAYLTGAANGPHPRGEFAPWLLMGVGHYALNQWRWHRGRHYRAIDAAKESARIPPAAPSASPQGLRPELVSLLATLKPPQRRCVHLLFLEGQSVAATAQVLGRATVTVRVNRRRALAHLHDIAEGVAP